MENASSNERLEFIVRSTILDRPRLLTINREYFEFDDKERVSEAPTRFLKADIAALRYGVKAIRGYRFRIGRIYCIDVINASGAIIKIRLKSVYRVRRKLLEKPENYRAFIFLDDWNAGVLRGLIETILKRKFPAKKID